MRDRTEGRKSRPAHKLHILLLHYYPNPNPDYPNLAAGLRARGHTVWLGARNQAGDLEWHDGQQVVGVLDGPASTPAAVARIAVLNGLVSRVFSLGFILRLRSFIRRVRPDFVQVNPASLWWLPVLPVAMPRQTVFILDIKQINLGVHPGWRGRLRDWQVVQARRICARYFYDHAGFDHALAARHLLGKRWQDRATVVPVGLHPSFLEAQPRASLDGLKDSRLRFVYVGTLAKFRELERLLHAAQRLLGETDRFRIDFIGPDTTAGYYQELAEQLGLGEVVTFRPPVRNDQMPEILAGYDVGLAFVPDRLTWHLQPAIKVLEYRALGLPILSTDVTSHREVVQEGVNGLLVPNSAEALAEGMHRFVQDRAFLHSCRKNAQAMRTGITLAQVAEAHEQQIYHKLRGHRPAAAV